jgi:AraC-like DNA-binding protein
MDIPVILLTARGSGESKLEGLELGADDYLTKPLSGRELRLRVRNLIARLRKLQQRFRRQLAGLDGKPVNLSLPSADEKFLQRATEVAEKHLTEPEFGAERFAHEMAMSRAHLNRKLRGLLGQRTGDFIRTLRLKRAAELLRQKSGTVSEIAFQVGFNHLSYFARSFKAQYGQSPSEYGQ